MTDSSSRREAPRKFHFYLLLNILIAVLLLATVPIIRAGQANYEQHASVDGEYVKSVLSTGAAEEVGLALKFTEISRAVAYNDYANMLTVMQVVAILLAIMVAANIMILSRMRKEAPAHQTVSDQQ